jgi:hypothetical protein
LLLLKRGGRAESSTERRGRGRVSKGSWAAQWEKVLPLCVGINEVLDEEECAGREVSEDIEGSW